MVYTEEELSQLIFPYPVEAKERKHILSCMKKRSVYKTYLNICREIHTAAFSRDRYEMFLTIYHSDLVCVPLYVSEVSLSTKAFVRWRLKLGR